MFPGNAECTRKETYSVSSKIKRLLPDGKSSLLMPNVSVAQMCCSSNIFMGKLDVSLQTSRSVTVTSAKSCTRMSCCQVAPFSK